MKSCSYFVAEDTGVVRSLALKWIKGSLPAPSFPSDVQIQTKAGCNAQCVFCPNGHTHAAHAPTEMDERLFRRLVDECLDNGTERVSPYLMDEPMLDRRLPDLIAYISNHPRRGPKAVSKINSNGSLLNEEMARRLLDSGLDRLNFSVHGIVPEEYERTMRGLKLQKVLDNIDRFLDLKRSGNYALPRVRVTMVRTKVLEPQLPAVREYWGSRKVKVNIRALENRAHDATKENAQLAVEGFKPYTWCNRLFEQAYIINDGRLVLCCVDWDRTAVMGDAAAGAIKDIWNGPKYRAFRRRFLKGDVRGMLCERCGKETVAEE